MGGTNSKFRKYVENGDEESSQKLLEEHSEVLKSFNANEPLNELLESALLLCCKWSMTALVKTLLYDCNGNPNRKNVFNQTALHLICQIPVRTDDELNETPEHHYSDDTSGRRADCLNLILDWNRVCRTNKNKKVIETMDINGLDRNGNTALHLAAANGLLDCVKILVDNKCELFIENESGDIASDLAAKANHSEVLQYLEFKMVYSDQSNSITSNNGEYNPKEEYLVYKTHDLEEAKNQLIVETSNMLNVSLSSAEVLLRSFDWSQESLIDQWFNDFETSAKESHFNFFKDNEVLESQNTVQDICEQQSVKQLCEICSLELDPNSTVDSKCGHQFCWNCWRTYLELKIESGDTAAITCPAFNCSFLVTMEIIEKVVSPDLTDRFVQNDIEAFVESNPCIKRCPNPGCNQAVYLPENKISLNNEQSYILANMPPLLPISHAVDCGSGHYFCWECKREAHSPCDCKLWEEWLIKISDIKAEELKQSYLRTEDVANSLWLVRNAKRCPRCTSYIQKSDGCNHLRCSKCKFDFCWICLESWKKHNSGTGGYFRCTRSEAAQRAEQNICLLKRVAESQNCEMKELKKFVFNYTKYKLNNMSNEMQTSLTERSKGKQKELFDYSIQLLKEKPSETVAENDIFLCEATLELIRSRKILCGSAVYGYYMEDHGYNKAIFEYMEHNLNYLSNRLSDIISCHYLRNSRNYIIDLTNKLRNKRIELLSAVSNGLIPPETPPGLKHHKRHCLPGVLALDSMENLSNLCDENDNSLIDQAIISSLSDFDQKNSWIQDRSGRHSNLLVIYDWPDDCHIDYTESESEVKSNKSLHRMSESESESEVCANVCNVCSNPYCPKPKAKNPRTGETHDFCSLKCKYMSEDTNSFEVNYKYDSSMDLLLAIEMSKISFEEEKQRLNDRQSVDSNQDSSEENNENAFESFVQQIKTNENLSDSSTKTAVMFFLKSSFTELIDDKNLNPLPNNMKVEKKLFSKNI